MVETEGTEEMLEIVIVSPHTLGMNKASILEMVEMEVVLMIILN